MTTFHYHRLYADGSVSPTIVLDWAGLMDHIEYNKRQRPGCAQFVNGECVHSADIATETIAKHLKDLRGKDALVSELEAQVEEERLNAKSLVQERDKALADLAAMMERVSKINSLYPCACSAMECMCEDPVERIVKDLTTATDLAEKLQAFKDFVHRRLDEMGVPSDPGGVHSAEGCRVGDRLDIVQAWKPK